MNYDKWYHFISNDNGIFSHLIGKTCEPENIPVLFTLIIPIMFDKIKLESKESNKKIKDIIYQNVGTCWIMMNYGKLEINMILYMINKCPEWFYNDPAFCVNMMKHACEINSYMLFVSLASCKSRYCYYREILEYLVCPINTSCSISDKIIYYILDSQPCIMFEYMKYMENSRNDSFTFLEYVCHTCDDKLVNIFIDMIQRVHNYSQKLNRYAVYYYGNKSDDWHKRNVLDFAKYNPKISKSTKERMRTLGATENTHSCCIM